jgi:pseudaminic acid biosynthesis-associated methylase
MSGYVTEQERFWAGAFGAEYTERNQGPALLAANLSFFGRVLASTRDVTRVLELGANRGMNLIALRSLLPSAALEAVEINEEAVAVLKKEGFKTHQGSLLDFRPAAEAFDLTFTKGVLIHIAPEELPRAYDVLHASSRRYVLVAEYYNPSPMELPYRGHAAKLFKRDFAGELMDRHPDLQLIDYGFLYRRDPVFAQDDISWFLMEKRSAA